MKAVLKTALLAITALLLRDGLATPNPPTNDFVSATGQEIAAGLLSYKNARTTGVVASVSEDPLDPNYNWMILRTQTSSVSVSLKNSRYKLSDLKKLLDAEIEVSGPVMPMSGWRENLSQRMALEIHGDFRILAAPPADPFSVPEIDGRRTAHRQRLSGRVIAVGQRRVFIWQDKGYVVAAIPNSEAALPKPNEVVTLSGFADCGSLLWQFSEALFRRDGLLPPLPENLILPLDSDTLGSKRIPSGLQGRIIRIRGVVTSYDKEPSGEEYLMVRSGMHDFSVDMSSFPDLLPSVRNPNTVIEVTGILFADLVSSPTSPLFPNLRRFTITPRQTADIALIQATPWWTPARLCVLVIILAVVLIPSLIGNKILKSLAERRGQQLYRERLNHALAEEKVEERTRLAIELHDSLSQTLTGVAMQLEAGDNGIAKRMLASCRSELRCCLWDLRSRSFEEKDLAEAIRRTISPHAGSVSVDIDFNVPRKHISESTTHAVLRIVRELVVNAIRHGHATRIQIKGALHNGLISLSVRDDGCGFDPSSVPGPGLGHFGLLGIRERLNEFNGKMKISSSAGNGTAVEISLEAGTTQP